ncbi:hypothetical protein LINPERHAP1_LOCUS15393 [Linum perenne]
MHLIHQETSLLVGVRISPIMYPETFTKAVIVVESVEQLEELCKFLDSPSHFVVSESGRYTVSSSFAAWISFVWFRWNSKLFIHSFSLSSFPGPW